MFDELVVMKGLLKQPLEMKETFVTLELRI